MLRKMMMAAVAAATIAVVAVPTEASARWHGGGGWHGGGWHHGWGGGFRGFGYYPYAYGAYGAYGGCYRPVRVWTPWGPRWRRTFVC
jgi:hypothetical protein